MALSKSETPLTAQLYLVCGTKDCKKNCQFYCNPCHRPLCKQCRDEHQKSPETKNHEVVPNQQCQRPVDKCKVHPDKDKDMFCEQCQAPLCSKCATNFHRGHIFVDLETVPPIVMSGQLSKDEVAKLLERITVSDTKSGKREMNPMESASTQLKTTGTQKAQNIEKCPVKKKLCQFPSVIEVMEFKVPDIKCAFHISLGKDNKPWTSDDSGTLVQTDIHGNRFQILLTNGRYESFHSVTRESELMYTDKKMRVIKKITLENKLTKFIEKVDWTPLSIYCSRFNGDILVGKITKREGKVTRYNDTGVEIQSFQRDNKEQEIYKYPHYITENVNRDICTSDYGKKAVVVVDKSGQHRFSYKGQESKFDPYGICTDILGHILVCDFESNSVHVLDQNGQFVFVLLTPLHGVKQPRGLCVDEDDFLFVTQDNTNTVKVFQYLQ